MTVLKNLWDSRNPSKCSISVNTLCCHARNITTSHMLTEYELMNIQAACSGSGISAVGDDVLLSDPGSPVSPVRAPDDCPLLFPSDKISQSLRQKFIEVSAMDVRARPNLPRVSVTKSVINAIDDVNQCIVSVLHNCSPSLLQCVDLLYAAASLVPELLPATPTRTSCGSWRQRLESNIMNLRRELSRLMAGGYPPCGSRRLLYFLQHLHSKYNITSLFDFTIVVETLKQKVSSYAARLRKYKTRLLRHWQNLLFRQDEKKFYSELLGGKDVDQKPPDLVQLELFWRNIFENSTQAKLCSPWLDDLSSQLAAKSFTVGPPIIEESSFDGCLKRLRNWAAPGPDGIQGFWIKRFSALRSVLLSHFNILLTGAPIHVWFPIGRTILFPKAPDTTLPKNFRSITCLNVMYKLWTGCITELLLNHCATNNILHPAQKGCARGKVVSSDDIPLPDGSSIRQLNVGETYRYLGFFEAEGLDCVRSKKLIVDSYHRRLRLVWNLLLSGPRKTRATNSFCVPLLSYGFGIVPWTKKEIEQFDVSTRKTLTATCNHHTLRTLNLTD